MSLHHEDEAKFTALTYFDKYKTRESNRIDKNNNFEQLEVKIWQVSQITDINIYFFFFF